MFGISFPACAFFFFLKVKIRLHANSILQARISPQWLRELRRLWPTLLVTEKNMQNMAVVMSELFVLADTSCQTRSGRSFVRTCTAGWRGKSKRQVESWLILNYLTPHSGQHCTRWREKSERQVESSLILDYLTPHNGQHCTRWREKSKRQVESSLILNYSTPHSEQHYTMWREKSKRQVESWLILDYLPMTHTTQCGGKSQRGRWNHR